MNENQCEEMRDIHMHTEWSLTKLYTSYKDSNFISDFNKTDELVKELEGFVANLGQKTENETLLEAVNILEALSETFEKLIVYASLRQSADTGDVESASYLGRLNEKVSMTTKSMTALKKYVAGICDLDRVLSSDPILKEYEYYFTCMKEDFRYALSDEVEEVIAKFNISGGLAWSDLQSNLTSTVKAVYNGEEVTLSTIRNLASDKEEAVRKAAYEAELACYDKIKDSVAFALNSIKLQVINECKLRGFDSALSETLHGARMKRETLDALMDAIKEYLPAFQEYLKVKARKLGHEHGLPWYDLFAPMGNNDKKYTIEEAKDYLVTLFHGFSKDLADMVTRAFEEEWIDFYPREGKVGGAFCCDIHAIKESRILTNFDGSTSAVVTLAHELGHAYHNLNIAGNRPLNTAYSMPVAETASTFNENIIMNAAIANAEDKELKLSLVESQLQDVTQIILDIYSRYLFETAVFEHRSENFMFSDQLCDMMLKAQKEAYGDGLDENFLHPYMWVCKGHYYSSEVSFYNFPYAFGGLFARGLYAKYQQLGEAFVPTYKKLLNATTVMSVEEVAKIADIDLTDKEFWKMGLQSYVDQIELFKELV